MAQRAGGEGGQYWPLCSLEQLQGSRVLVPMGPELRLAVPAPGGGQGRCRRAT